MRLIYKKVSDKHHHCIDQHEWWNDHRQKRETHVEPGNAIHRQKRETHAEPGNVKLACFPNRSLREEMWTICRASLMVACSRIRCEDIPIKRSLHSINSPWEAKRTTWCKANIADKWLTMWKFRLRCQCQTWKLTFKLQIFKNLIILQQISYELL